MDSLHQSLECQGFENVNFIVINQQGIHAWTLHSMLEERLSKNITLYRQEDGQPDVWQTLRGKRDDFLIYDRCGRLTHQISSPNSTIGKGHIEGAIKDAYCKRLCGDCPHEVGEEWDLCQNYDHLDWQDRLLHRYNCTHQHLCIHGYRRDRLCQEQQEIVQGQIQEHMRPQEAKGAPVIS